MKEPHLVPVGKITRTHGIRGALKVYSYGDTLVECEPGDVLTIGAPGQPQIEITIRAIQPHKAHVLIASFEGMEDIDSAASLVGKEICLPEDRLPPLGEGEYYHYQLIGLSVRTKRGDRIGILTGIIETGGNDVYAVQGQEGEVLIPAIEDVIVEVDLEAGIMVVDPPEGLIG